jgi:hypothetical protein
MFLDLRRDLVVDIAVRDRLGAEIGRYMSPAVPRVGEYYHSREVYMIHWANDGRGLKAYIYVR